MSVLMADMVSATLIKTLNQPGLNNNILHSLTMLPRFQASCCFQMLALCLLPLKVIIII